MERSSGRGGEISEAVRKVLAGYPQLDVYLNLGVINSRALGRLVQGEVSRSLGRDVNLQSIVTAIRRYPSTPEASGRARLSEILAKSRVTLRYDMGTLTIRIGPQTPRKIQKLYPSMGETAILIQGVETLTLVLDEGRLEALEESFREEVTDVKRGLASLIVISPPEIAITPGVLAHLAGLLALEGINVVEMMSSYTETCFVIREEEALQAMEFVRSEIKRARRK
jgi:hypothetical protein